MMWLFSILGFLWIIAGVVGAICYHDAVYEARIWPNQYLLWAVMFLAFLVGPISATIGILYWRAAARFLNS